MAAAACAVLWPELRLELGPLGPGWMTASDFFASPDAVDGLLAHERALCAGADGPQLNRRRSSPMKGVSAIEDAVRLFQLQPRAANMTVKEHRRVFAVTSA